MAPTQQKSPSPTPVRADAAAPTIQLDGLRKTFRRKGGDLVPALDDVSLEVVPGEMVVLLGPSGCGKTTLLRCIAGLEDPDGGEITLQGSSVVGPGRRPVPPEDRGIGMMFQSYALWPHMTVEQNVAYPLQGRRLSKREIRDRVLEVLRLAGIDSLVKQYPGNLSGGQQQRVALARCLVSEPAIILFDEPLSNVDAKVRAQLRYEIVAMREKLGFSAIYVTHDQDEAMQVAHRIAVMREGRIVQLSRPEDVYLRPSSEYVAQFLGELNRTPVTRWSGQDEYVVAATGLGDVQLLRDNVDSGLDQTRTNSLVFRPEHVLLGASEPGPNSWAGTVAHRSFVGMYSEYIVELDEGTRLTVRELGSGARGHRVGDRVRACVAPGDVRVIENDLEAV